MMQQGLTGSCFYFGVKELTPVPQVFQILYSLCLEMLHVAERAVRGCFNETSAGKEGHGEERDESCCQNRNFASTRRQLIKDLPDSTWL